MKEPKKKQTKEQKLQERIEKLLFILNSPETSCLFWRINEPNAHLMGIRPVKRTTVEVVNPNGFNPYDKKIEENLFKCFKIFILDSKNNIVMTEEEIKNKKDIEKSGVIYIKNNDLVYIFDCVRKSS